MPSLRFCLDVRPRHVVPFLALLDSLAPRAASWRVSCCCEDPALLDFLRLIVPPDVEVIPWADVERDQGRSRQGGLEAPLLLDWALSRDPAPDIAVWLEPTVFFLAPLAELPGLADVAAGDLNIVLFEREEAAAPDADGLVERAARSSLILAGNGAPARSFLRRWLGRDGAKSRTGDAPDFHKTPSSPGMANAPEPEVRLLSDPLADPQAWSGGISRDGSGRLLLDDRPVPFLNCRQARLVAPGWLAPFAAPAFPASPEALAAAVLPWAERMQSLLDMLLDAGGDAALFSSDAAVVRPDDLLLAPEDRRLPLLDRGSPPIRLSGTQAGGGWLLYPAESRIEPVAPQSEPKSALGASSSSGQAAGQPRGPADPAISEASAKPLRLAEALLVAGKPSEAAALLLGAARLQPGLDRLADLLGRLADGLPSPEAAPAALPEALGLALAANRCRRDVALRLAGLLAAGGDLAGALTACQAHLDLYPDAPELKPLSVGLHERLLDERLSACLKVRPERRGPYAVTAIVSVWRAEEFMAECLGDLLAQTIADRLEIVVLDAASPQRERGVVEEFQRLRPDILYLRAPERNSVYQAWNMAIRAASGRYVTPFSANDRLRPEAYAMLAAALDARPDAALAYGDTVVTRTAHQGFAEALAQSSQGADTGVQRWGEYDVWRNLAEPTIGPHPMWRRELHGLEGYFDERCKALADQDFWLRLGRGRAFAYVPEPTGLAWLTRESLSGQAGGVQELAAIQRRWRAALVAERLRRPERAARPLWTLPPGA